jgi:uncharacterized Fe-S cluster protein YjdI
MKKEYSNGEVTIIWQPDLCIHCGNCAKGLPAVFHPRTQPWITANEATTSEIINQINQCPSGALSFKMNAETGESNPS